MCVACGSPGQLRYCPACGQRKLEGRHTLRSFAGGLLTRIIGEEGVLRTAWLLTKDPGHVIGDYIAGKTVRYVNPVGYLLFATALFAVIGQTIGGSTGAAESDRLLAILIVPFVGLASRAIWWRGPSNIAEHLILVTFLGGQVLVLLTVLYVGMLIVPSTLEDAYAVLALTVGLMFFVWGYASVFQRRRWLAALAALLSLVSGAAVWLIFLGMIVRTLGN